MLLECVELSLEYWIHCKDSNLLLAIQRFPSNRDCFGKLKLTLKFYKICHYTQFDHIIMFFPIHFLLNQINCCVYFF